MVQWLDDPRLLEETQRKIAKKLQHLDVLPQQRTLRLRAQRAELATDQAEWRPNQAERPRETIDSTLERLGFQIDGSQHYTLAQVDDMLARRLASDPELRMACKTRLKMLGVLLEHATKASTSTTSHPLHRLVQTVLGPKDEDEAKDEDDQQQASRTLRASADRRRGVLLTDRRGRPLVLRSVP